MPIPLPKLDDRRWTDLVEDGRSSIPRYAPQWTDYNVHDPGITIIDLFAWLAEMTNYRLDRVPARHKRKFLHLLGFAEQGPTPARAVLSWAPSAGTPPFVLPAGAEFEGLDPDQKRVSFRTLNHTTVQASSIQALLVDDGSGVLASRTSDYLDRLPIEPLGSHPAPGAALYFGFDALTAGQPLSIGLFFDGHGNDEAERERIIKEATEEAAFCRPATTRFDCGSAAPTPAIMLPPHHSVVVIWEAFTSSGWAPLQPWDDTRSLTLDGIVEITPPANAVADTLSGAVASPLFFIRCRITTGSFDVVPMLRDVVANAVRAEQSVPVTEKFIIKKGAAVTGPAPTPGDSVALAFAPNGTAVIQSLDFGVPNAPLVRVWSYEAPTATNSGEITIDLELAGTGSGLPGQALPLRSPQADPASISVYTLATSKWQQWSARSDFDSSGRTDFHFTLDAATSTISFGDGERGQTPPANASILVAYRTTLAEGGNLAARAVDRPRQSPVNTVLLKALPPATAAQLKTITMNPRAGQGGARFETLDNALGRVVEVLHAHERLLDLAQSRRTTTLDQIDRMDVRSLRAPSRGVNLLDLERIALEVPGTRIARAHAWASMHADYPCLDTPGVVTIVVVPEYPVDMPVPSPGLITRVWRYLDRRRMVATSLIVAGPSYVGITATANVTIRPGASTAGVQARILSVLDAFLNPLTGGPDGFGWPFGRSVYRAEIFSLIQDVPGVDHVVSLSLQSDSGGPQCGDIALCPTELTRSGAHKVEVA